MSVVVESAPAAAGVALPGTIVIPGKEARHAIGTITLGNLDTWPRFRILDIIGLRASPDGAVPTEGNPGHVGERRRRRVREGKTISYVLSTEGRDLQELRRGQALRESVFQEDAELQVTISQHPDTPNRVAAVTYRASVISNEPGTEKPPDKRRAMSYGYEQESATALRMHDPRFYLVAPVIAETAPFVTEKGITLPASAPFRIPAPDLTPGYVEITNSGPADTDPILDLYGPAPNPTVENLTTGGRLTFPGLTIGTGQFLRIDFFRRTILLNNESNYRRFLNRAASTWWDATVSKILPGRNLIRYSGSGIANPARAVVSIQPATF
ncbi:MAG: phage tail family protein [Actinomycetota bacterium]|nr:phage tail family protein [Actinomycetota bacterium]